MLLPHGNHGTPGTTDRRSPTFDELVENMTMARGLGVIPAVALEKCLNLGNVFDGLKKGYAGATKDRRSA